MDERAKNRVRLWLRSERAMGLTAVPVPRAAQAGDGAESPGTSERPRAVAAAPPPQLALPKATPAPFQRATTPTPAPPAPPPPAPPFAAVARPNEMAPWGGLLAPSLDAPFDTPELAPAEKRLRLEQLDASEVKGCTRCRLCQTRTNTVFGEGDPNARIFFIGEGPGENEDLQGRPFVGRAGELLNKMIAGMGLRREQVFIANIVKCLRYNTLVQLENGSWERIGRLVRQRYGGRVMSVAADGSLVPKRVTGWHASPLAGRRVYRLSYASSALRGGNRAVTWLTHDHEVMTRRGWVRAEDLRPDVDEVAVGQGLSRIAYEVAVGSLLGDGTISPKNAYLGIAHRRDHRTYLRWKCEALREFSPIVYDGSCAAKTGGPRYLTTVARTRATRSLRVLRGRFYNGRRKCIPRDLCLTSRILAVWFLDDGHLRVRAGKAPLAEIAAHSFAAADIAYLIERLARDVGVEGYVRESSPGRIHFGVDATRRLSEIIAPFCPPCLRYKVHPAVERVMPFDAALYTPGAAETLYDHVLIEEVDFAGADRTFFCIDVEDTNNFVTSGGVVHNCRPPNNRVPAPDEVATCTPYLERQLEIVRPKVIVTLGLPAAKYMLQTKLSMGRLRGQWHAWRGIKLMPTFHPAYLLRSYTPENRAAVWSDLKAVLGEVGLPVPQRGKGA